MHRFQRILRPPEVALEIIDARCRLRHWRWRRYLQRVQPRLEIGEAALDHAQDRQICDPLLDRMQHLRIDVFGCGSDTLDLCRQPANLFGEAREGFVRGDIGDNAAQCRDRTFKLLQRGRVLIGTAGMIDTLGQIADRVFEARKTLGRLQAADSFPQFIERTLHAGNGFGVHTCGAAHIDPLGEPADFRLERFDGAARHGFGQASADFAEIAAQFTEHA